jgi:hypothetical protein
VPVWRDHHDAGDRGPSPARRSGCRALIDDDLSPRREHPGPPTAAVDPDLQTGAMAEGMTEELSFGLRIGLPHGESPALAFPIAHLSGNRPDCRCGVVLPPRAGLVASANS